MDLKKEDSKNNEQEVIYKISEHAYERFAERIMGYTNQIDVRRYVNQNRDLIAERINKTINYAELFYEGVLRDYSCNKVFVKENWVIIVNPNKNLVVTLYKVDFGLEVDEDGIDFNKLFLEKHKSILAKAKEDLNEYKNNTQRTIDQYENFISENDNEIKILNKRINSLKSQNDGYLTLIKGYKDNINFREKEITNIVDNMVCRKKF